MVDHEAAKRRILEAINEAFSPEQVRGGYGFFYDFETAAGHLFRIEFIGRSSICLHRRRSKDHFLWEWSDRNYDMDSPDDGADLTRFLKASAMELILKRADS